MNFPPILTLGEASKALGVSKTTISNRIKAGLPHNGNSKDGYKIQLADLQQRYPDEWNKAEQKRAEQSSNGQDNRPSLQSVTPQLDPSLQALTDAHQETVKALREVMAEKDNQIQDRDGQIEHWKAEVSKANNLLDDKRSDADKAQALLDAEIANKPKIKKRKIGFFERLRIKEVIEVEEVA